MKRGYSVALVGIDGAGKTSVARHIERNFGPPLKYMYMGCELDRSNVAVFTRRIARSIGRAVAMHSGRLRSASPKRGRLTDLLWTANLMLDEVYRQVISWYYQRKGFVVLYDRHFAFDYAPGAASRRDCDWFTRVHQYFLARVYPAPDLVVFLRAPVDALFARKPEGDIAQLRQRAESLEWSVAAHGKCITIDALQPLPAVCSQVQSAIMNFRRDADEGSMRTHLQSDEPAA